MSQGGIKTISPGLRIVTVLLPLETSIPVFPLPIQSTGYITRTPNGSTCVKRMLRIRGWLADYFTDVKSWEEGARPIATLILTA